MPAGAGPGELSLLQRFIGELLGTYGLVFASTGAVMIAALSDGGVTPLGINAAPGLAVAAMIYAFGGISGAHINPAVTLAFALSGQIPGKTALYYLPAQLTGAILASLTLYILFGPTAEMGATLPAGSLSQSLAMEIILTFFLMTVIMAVSADAKIAGGLAALAIGLTVGLAVIFAGPISGASMNPARSFAPALLADNWHGHWLYWVGPILGAALGALVLRWLKGWQSARPAGD